MTTINTLCPVCRGDGLIEQNDTTATCGNCHGTGYIQEQAPDAIYPRLQRKIDAAIADGAKTIDVDPSDARLMIQAGYVRDDRGTAINRELGHGKVSLFVTKTQPAQVEAQPPEPPSSSDTRAEKTITIWEDVSDEAMVGGDGWGNYDAAASTSEFTDQVIAKVQSKYPGYRVVLYETDYRNEVEIVDDRDEVEDYRDIEADQNNIREIVSDVYQALDWYIEDDEKVEAETELETVMTAAEACEVFGLSESTVRQAINRETIPARKSGETWLILRKHAEARWAKR